MINSELLSRLQRFNPSNIEQIENALREALQEIILCGIAKSDFFNYAAFYGGTSLRIFRNLPRFSEDLDFILIKEKEDFDFDYYLSFAKKELDRLLIVCDIYSKEKKIKTNVISRNIKFSLKQLIEYTYPEYQNIINHNQMLAIKVEIEKEIINGGIVETKLLTYPSFAQIKTFDINTLFSSKLLAILFRNWKTRNKGRDFYDYLFYLFIKAKVNLTFIENGLKKNGYINSEDSITLDRLKEELKNRFENIDFSSIKNDIKPFISNNDKFINSFDKEIFIDTLDLLERE